MRLASLPLLLCLSAAASPQTDTLEHRIRGLRIETATIREAVSLFGEPVEYVWGDTKYQQDKLPVLYLARFSSGIAAVVQKGDILELRVEAAGVKILDRLEIGSSLDTVLQVLGPPKAVVEGQMAGVPGVLYKDFQGQKGTAYYSSREKGIRVFCDGGKVVGLILCRKNQFPDDVPETSNSAVLAPYDDVRAVPDKFGRDASHEDLSARPDLLATLSFNESTVWPDRSHMPVSPTPRALIESAVNPGLGVRELHARGITGKGVSVAIVDQPLIQNHPEYAGKIAAYYDVGTGQQSSMHGPAVASLLVGTHAGTAPEARLYFAAAPSWNQDSADQAQALRWIVEQNRKLPTGQKIRVVSVSAAPSGKGSPFTRNLEQWDQAVDAAEREGILVLDCTDRRAKIFACWFDGADREHPSQCRPGYPGMEEGSGGWGTRRLLAPASPRATAEVYREGAFGYQYTGRGGLSWAIPYVAGVLAMGWQVRPELSSGQMMDMLFQTAYRRGAEALVIDPPAFIQALERSRPASVSAAAQK